MFGRRLMAFAGIVVLVAASIIALWPAAPEAPGIRPEQEFAPGDSSLPVAVEDRVVAGGLTFDSVKPTAEVVAVRDNIDVKNIRSMSKGPIIVTLANMTTSQNLGAMGGLDTSIVGQVLADLVVENTGHDRITHIQFDVLVLLDELRVSDEQITINDLKPGEKVIVRTPATVIAGDIPQRLKESFAFMLEGGTAPQFSVRMANLDVPGY